MVLFMSTTAIATKKFTEKDRLKIHALSATLPRASSRNNNYRDSATDYRLV